MTRRQVWQYKCDFCGKRGLSGGHMKNHEKSCTANPNRVCRMHPHVAGEPATLTTVEILKRWDRSKSAEKYGMDQLRKLADDCPMCILAAIRQSGLTKWDGDPESTPIDLGFNFKDELKAAWQTINDAKADDEEMRREMCV